VADLKLNTQVLVGGVIVIIGVILALGVMGRVSALEGRASALEAQFTQLEQLNEEMAALEERVTANRTDIAELSSARDDILRAICDLLGRPPQQCGLVPDS